MQSNGGFKSVGNHVRLLGSEVTEYLALLEKLSFKSPGQNYSPCNFGLCGYYQLFLLKSVLWRGELKLVTESNHAVGTKQINRQSKSLPSLIYSISTLLRSFEGSKYLS